MSGQPAERVRPNGDTVYLVNYWLDGSPHIGSVHATRASAEAFRHEGDTILAWGVHDLERHSGGDVRTHAD